MGAAAPIFLARLKSRQLAAGGRGEATGWLQKAACARQLPEKNQGALARLQNGVEFCDAGVKVPMFGGCDLFLPELVEADRAIAGMLVHQIVESVIGNIEAAARLVAGNAAVQQIAYDRHTLTEG